MANTLLTVKYAQEEAKRLYEEAYGDLDNDILACMAAGVSVSQMYIKQPEAKGQEDAYYLARIGEIVLEE